MKKRELEELLIKKRQVEERLAILEEALKEAEGIIWEAFMKSAAMMRRIRGRK